MCSVSAAVAVRKIQTADPADIFWFVIRNS
jgi:hypothetical protein